MVEHPRHHLRRRRRVRRERGALLVIVVWHVQPEYRNNVWEKNSKRGVRLCACEIKSERKTVNVCLCVKGQRESVHAIDLSFIILYYTNQCFCHIVQRDARDCDQGLIFD